MKTFKIKVWKSPWPTLIKCAQNANGSDACIIIFAYWITIGLPCYTNLCPELLLVVFLAYLTIYSCFFTLHILCAATENRHALTTAKKKLKLFFQCLASTSIFVEEMHIYFYPCYLKKPTKTIFDFINISTFLDIFLTSLLQMIYQSFSGLWFCCWKVMINHTCYKFSFTCNRSDKRWAILICWSGFTHSGTQWYSLNSQWPLVHIIAMNHYLLIWIRGNLTLAISGTKFIWLPWIQDESSTFLVHFPRRVRLYIKIKTLNIHQI